MRDFKWLLVGGLALAASGLAGCACGGGDEKATTDDKGDEKADEKADKKADEGEKADEGDKEDSKSSKKGKKDKKDKKDKGEEKEGEQKEGEEASFEDQVAASKALKPSPKTQTVGGKDIEAELCKIEGRDFLGTSTSSMFKAVELIDDRLIVVDGEGQLNAFKIKDEDGCTLKLDKDFGDKGALKLKDSIEYLSSDKSGRIVASHGIFNAYSVKDGKEEFACKTGGYIELHESGKWGIAPWVNATVKIVEFKDGACTLEDWVLKNLSQDDKREGIFGNVNTSAIIGDKIFIGGILTKSVNSKEPRVVQAYDRKGKELFRFGNEEKSFDDNGFGWVHAIEGCEGGVCVLDSNFRRISVWSSKGDFVGAISLKDLLDLKYPWLSDFTLKAGKGDAFIAASQSRDDSKVVEGLIYKIKGL